jgi:exopolysaccharide biosynthesis polyprenyl glycosylphosphotransferase
MLWRPAYHKRLAQLADVLTTGASFVLAYFAWQLFRIKTNISLPIDLNIYSYWIVFGMSLAWVFFFSVQEAYAYQRFTSLPKEFWIVARTTAGGVVFFMLANFLLRFGYIPRTFVLIFMGVNFACLCLEKVALFHVAKSIRKKGIGRKKVLVVGAGKEAGTFLEVVEHNIGWGIDIVGIVLNSDLEACHPELTGKILGPTSQLESIMHAHVIDEIIICNSADDLMSFGQILECGNREGVQVRLYSNEMSRFAKKIRVDSIYGMNIISFINVPDDEFRLYVKRAMDIAISGALLVLLSPVFILISIMIKINSKGKVFYRWDVIGLNKKPFTSWKFRTMVPNADDLKDELLSKNEMTGPVFKIKEDPRITKVGKVLRKFSFDELPQLWSVFKGDMSLVGPRPAGPHELARYESWHRKKLSIKPGITCIWQASGRNEINDFDDWVRMDLAYIDNWTLGLDIKIIIKTIFTVLRGTGC